VWSSPSAWSSVIASRHLSIPLNGSHAASSVPLSLRVSVVSVTAQALDLKSQVCP
jgi:hypothetical protein